MQDNVLVPTRPSPVPGGLEAQRDGPGAGTPPHHRQHGPSGLDLFSLGSFDQALPLAQQSLQLSEKALGPEHPQTAQSLMVLGSLYGQMGVHDKALSLSQRALQISEKVSGPDRPADRGRPEQPGDTLFPDGFL